MQSFIASRVKTFFLGDLIVSGLSHGDYFAVKEIEEVFIDVKVTAHFLEMGVDFRRNRRRIAICHPACEETAECGNGVVGVAKLSVREEGRGKRERGIVELRNSGNSQWEMGEEG